MHTKKKRVFCMGAALSRAVAVHFFCVLNTFLVMFLYEHFKISSLS